MSLQIWLPLMEDFHNQGVSTVKYIVNGTFTTANDGNFGKCQVFNNTNVTNNNDACYLEQASSSYSFSQASEFSIAYWCNVVTNQAGLFSIRYNTGAVQFTITDTGLGFRDSNHSSFTTLTYEQPTVGVWTHYIIVYKQGNFYIYKNGSLIYTKTYTNTATLNNFSAHTIRIGRYQTSSGNIYYDGKLNDFRIYDHALSDKEIKELSKCLILHYKLDEKSNWLLSYPERSVARKSNNTFLDYDYYNDLISSTDFNFNLKFLAKGSQDNVKIDAYFRDSNASSYAVVNSPVFLTTEWKEYNLTITGSPANLDLFRFRCYSTSPSSSIAYIKNVSLTSANMPIRQTEIKDVSGYNNNGIIIGSPTIKQDSKRYNYCMHFDTGQHIKVQKISNTFLPTTALTVNAWVKYTTNGAIVSCTQSGGICLYPTSFVVYISTTQKKLSVTAVPTNEWHMLTGVYNGEKMFYYQDAVKIKQATVSGSIYYVNKPLFIGAEAGSGMNADSSSHIIGDISDVRIYATALSDEDIKELYETSVSLDNKSNIYSRQFEENNLNKISITNRGQLQMDAIEEDSSTASFYNDTDHNIKGVKGKLIYEY